MNTINSHTEEKIFVLFFIYYILLLIQSEIQINGNKSFLKEYCGIVQNGF